MTASPGTERPSLTEHPELTGPRAATGRPGLAGDDVWRVTPALLRAAPALARLALAAGWRVAGWTLVRSLETTGGVLRSVASGQAPVLLVEDAVAELRVVARRALGLAALPLVDATVANGSAPGSGRPPAAGRGPAGNGKGAATAAELRTRGAALLLQSADVHFDVDIHPAYERILEELAPDEARILRLLATEGPQPSVDVRTARPLGIGSELVASGLSMIGTRAGVRSLERTKPYLNNLYRLGLVWFLHEPLPDPSRYQVVEVQPEVTAALKEAGRTGKTIRRSIVLTPFGEDFCRVCLPLEMPDGTSGPGTPGAPASTPVPPPLP